MKRGMSPLLSFILILLLIMAVFAFLFPWFTAFTRQLGNQGSKVADRPLYCDGISLSLSNFTRNRNSLYAQLEVENGGRFEIERFTITRETSYQPIASCLLLNVNLEPNRIEEISVPLFAAFNLQSSLCPVENVVSQVPCVFIKKIDLVPWINVNGIDISCVDKILEVDVSRLNAICGPIPVPPLTCSDGRKNGDETGIDCGGSCITNNPELCNNIDDNKDCNVDETFNPPQGNLGQQCTVGIGECVRQGTYVCKADGTGTQCSVNPGNPVNEICINGKDEDCDGTADDGCLVWTSNRFEFEDSITVGECDCNDANGYGGDYPKCSWFLANNYCSRYSPSVKDFGTCKDAANGMGVGQCVFLKNAIDPNLIGKDRWFAYNLPINIADPTVDLNLLECDVRVRIQGANDQNREDLFIMINGQSVTYLDDLNNPAETWEERVIGRFDVGRVNEAIEGQNIVRIGNPADPPEDAPFGLISSTHADWYQLLCYNPIVN